MTPEDSPDTGPIEVVGDPPPAAPESPVQPGQPAALVIRSAIAHGLRRLREQEASALALDQEGVHRMRVAVRRLRSLLRTFRPLLAGDRIGPLGDDLRGLADQLGAVRDLDVLRERLAKAADGEPPGSLAPLFEALADRRAEASEALVRGLRADRYRGLLDRLEAAARCPETTEAAREPCRSALPRLVAVADKALKRAGRRLGKDDPDRAYHRVRILAKRARHAAEAVAAALDPSASRGAVRFARRAAHLQDVLGEHQDAVQTCRVIARFLSDPRADRACRRTARRLLRRQRKAARAARRRFARAWRRFDRPGTRRWLKA